jgi:hypothetical protein
MRMRQGAWAGEQGSAGEGELGCWGVGVAERPANKESCSIMIIRRDDRLVALMERTGNG